MKEDPRQCKDVYFKFKCQPAPSIKGIILYK